MFSRVCAAACAAALGVGVLAAPAESSARGGGAAMGRIGGFHPPRPMPHGHPPVARVPRAVPPVLHGAVARVHAAHPAARRNQGAVSTFDGYGYPLTYGDNGAFYGSYYDPSDVVGSIAVPAYTPPLYAPPPAGPAPVAEREPQVFDRGPCRSQTVSVASPSGGERSITITRC
jgi:hypothetical protein